MANLQNIETQTIIIDVKSDDLPDFTAKAADASKKLSLLRQDVERYTKSILELKNKGSLSEEEQAKLFGDKELLKNAKKEIKSLTKELSGYSDVLEINVMSMQQLQIHQRKLKTALDETSKSLDPETWDRLNKEIIECSKQMRRVKAGTSEVSENMDITGMSMNQLRTYAKQLTDQMNDIPGMASNPDWQKLNDRLEEVNNQMGVIGKNTDLNTAKSTMWGNLMTKAVTTLMAGIKKVAQNFLEHSNVVGDQWARFTTGMKTSYETFLTALTTREFDNLISKMREAYIEGRRIAELSEDIFEMRNATTLTEVKNNIEISNQTAIMRDTTRSNEERIAASKEILRLEEEILNVKQKTALRAKEVAVAELSHRTGLEEDEMGDIIDNFFKNEKLIETASAYNTLNDELEVIKTNIETYEVQGMNYLDKNKKAAERYFEILEEMSKISTVEVREMAGMLKEYDLANDELIQAYVQAQVEFHRARADYAQGTIRAKTTQAQLEKELDEEKYAAALAAAAKHAEEQMNLTKQQYLDMEITEEECAQKLQNIQMKHNKAILDINKKFGKDVTAATTTVFDDQIKLMEDGRKMIADGALEDLEKFIEDAKALNAALDEQFANASLFVEVELQADSEQLANDIEAAGKIKSKFSDTNTKLDALSFDRDAELAQLESLHEQQLITEEEFQKAKNEIVRKYSQEAFAIQTAGLTSGLNAAMTALNGASQMISSIKEAQSAALDNQMQEELAAAGDNAEQRAAIEAKYEQQKLDLQKKYADAEMGINIAKAIAAGALASAQAWTAAKGNPVLAGIYIGMIAASTAAEVATLIAQRNAIKNSSVSSTSSTSATASSTAGSSSGYSEGGFTGYGGRLEPAGIVHRGEYVVPMPEMRNPDAYRHVMAIENIRTKRTHKNALPGYSEGGFVRAQPSNDAIYKELLALLTYLRDNPIKAYMVFSEFNAKQEIYTRLKKTTSRV